MAGGIRADKAAIIGKERTLQVTIDLPTDVAEQLRLTWGDVSRHILETIAVEGYRTGQLTTLQVRKLLGYQTPMELDELLKRANLDRIPDVQELEQDFEASRRASTKDPQNR
jgi:hypothetical protein